MQDRISARSTKPSCTARPDHTLGSTLRVPTAWLPRQKSLRFLPQLPEGRNSPSVPLPDSRGAANNSFAVGTRVTSRPPRRSVRAAFPHTAPTSGPNGNCLPHAGQRLCHAYPALRPARALLARIPLGPHPWLHQLRSGSLRFVRRLHSYYGRVRLLVPVHHRLRFLTFPMRTVPLTRH
jgi:hypothetical protein